MGTNSKNKTNPSGNDKLVKTASDGKGSYELVNDENHNLVTDPVNIGTYNYCDKNNSVVGHLILDMIPYYIWGNSPSDPTTMMLKKIGLGTNYSIVLKNDGSMWMCGANNQWESGL